jgi:hypothetical protein
MRGLTLFPMGVTGEFRALHAVVDRHANKGEVAFDGGYGPASANKEFSGFPHQEPSGRPREWQVSVWGGGGGVAYVTCIRRLNPAMPN